MKLSHPLQRQDIRFNMGDDIPRQWIEGESQSTRFFDALSCVIPQGEKFFIKSISHFREQIKNDPQLEKDVAKFIAQETTHAREHSTYNARLAAQGAPIDRMNQSLASHFHFFQRHLSPAGLLAITICFEHFTAIVGHQILKHPEIFDTAEPRMREIWDWHALEEVEHKSVAFDVFTRISPNPFIRYFQRCWFMLWVAIWLTAVVGYDCFKLLSFDKKMTDWAGWRKSLYRLFIFPTPLPSTFFYLMLWFIPGFHPWWVNSHSLIKAKRGRHKI